MSTYNWQQPASKVGQQLAKLGLSYWQNPGMFSNAGAAASSQASGFSGVGAGGVASLLAPLFMTWSAYTKGSGRNEPVEKYQKTKQIGRLLTDMLSGKQVDWGQLQGNYGVLPKYLPAGLGGGEDNGQGLNSGGTIDPRGWKARELYDQMIAMSAEYPQTGGVGDSWYTGNKINEAFGPYQDALAKAMGMDKLPDWTGHQKGGAIDYKSTQPRLQDDIMAAAASPEMRDYWKNNGLVGGDITKGWDSLDDNAKQEFRRRASIGRETGGAPVDETLAVQQYADEEAIKELNDKYKLGLKNPYTPPDPEANPFMNMTM